MARSRSRRTTAEEPELDPEGEATVEPGTIDDPEAYEEAKAAGVIEELPKKPPREPVKALPEKPIMLTAKRCLLARSTDPVVAAFLHRENLRKGGIRKLTREQWDAELEKFTSAPR